MPRRFSGIVSVIRCIALSAILLICSTSFSFAVTCDNPYNMDLTIGLEWVADRCVGDGMNDSTSIHYINNLIACDSANVYLAGSYGDTDATPVGLANYLKSQGYRVFRNKEGTHIMAVLGFYTGHIDGNYINSYATGQIYTDVFKQGLILPSTPDCQGSDFNNPGDPPNPNGPVNPGDPGSPPGNPGAPNGPPGDPTGPGNPPYPNPPSNPPPCTGNCCPPPAEQSGGSTINRGSGRLTHAQQLFKVNTGSSLFMGVSLHYVSQPFAPSAIGNGWSHNYEASLQIGANSIITYWTKGTQHTYTPYNGGYASPRGDYSTLVKNSSDGSYVITDTDGFQINFDASGVVTSSIDRYGNILNFVYTNGKLSGVNDASAGAIRNIAFTYYDDGKLKTITDPNNNIYTLAYINGFLETLTLPGNDQWGYTYNPDNNLLASKTDPNLSATNYLYTNQKVTTVIDPQLQNRGYFYPAPVSPGKIPDCYPNQVLPMKIFNYVEKDTGSWKYTYDTLTGRVKSKTDPLLNSTDYTYDKQGNMLSITEPSVNGIRYTTFFDYDAQDNVIIEAQPMDASANGIDPSTVTNPANDNRIKVDYRYSYDLTNPILAFKNRIKTVRDERNPANILTTTYTYNIDGNGYLVTTITNPANISATLRQYANGKLKDVTDANGKITSYTYRVDGLMESVTAPSGISVSYTDYDANGNVKEMQVKDSDGVLRKKTSLIYDSRNRLHISTIVAANQPVITATYGYDGNDNIKSVIDPELHETLYEYTYSRQVKKITNALGKVTILTYGSSSCPSCGGGVDQMTDVEDAKHHHTQFGYDLLGRLTKDTDPLGKATKYTYYNNGLIKEKIDATDPLNEKLLITYSYNNRRQLTTKHYSDGTPDAVFTYDNGGLKTASNANISYTFSNYTTGSYKGRPKNISDTTNNRTVSYDQYTNLGQRKQIIISDGSSSRTTTYQYDSANRPWIITAGTKIFTYLYDKLGRRDTISYPNGVTVKHGYNDLDRLTSIKHSTSTATISFANYSGFDKTGSRLNKITSNGTETYHYDTTYRLTQTDTLKGSEKYTYDDVGNRTGGPGPKESLPIVTYAYDAANRMTHGRQLGYDNDNIGNQITRTIPNGPDKGWTLTWDLENRLTQVLIFRKVSSVIVESRTIDFKYDPFDKRIEKKVTTLINGVTKISTWSYLYDGDNIAAEYFTDSTGTTTTTYYTHGPGVDEHLAMERDSTYYYYHTDGLGSITAITNDSAIPVQTYSYDSFGVAKQTTSFRNSFMYVGKEYDLETGLTEMGARYYDPREGRFLNKDPISYQGGINVFSYVQNNPIRYRDPSGLIDPVDLFFTLPFLVNTFIMKYNPDGSPSNTDAFKWLITNPNSKGQACDPNKVPTFNNYNSPTPPPQKIPGNIAPNDFQNT